MDMVVTTSCLNVHIKHVDTESLIKEEKFRTSFWLRFVDNDHF